MNEKKSQDRPSRRKLSRRKKLIFGLVICLLFFGALELCLRAFWTPPADQPTIVERTFAQWLANLVPENRTEQLYQEDEQVLWKLIPGKTMETYNHHHHPDGEKQPVTITINKDGYRGAIATQDPDTIRILCLGDSNFFGYPLDDQFAFPRVLQNVLNETGQKFEIINGGVPGFSALQGKRWYQSQFQHYDFDVLMLSFVNNDGMLQRYSDQEVFERKKSTLYQFSDVARHSHIVRLADALVAKEPQAEDLVRRVSLEEYEQIYRWFFQECENRDMELMLLDYRAYPSYAPYSRMLESLAQSAKVPYLPVMDTIKEEFGDLKLLELYPDLAKQVHRRWGDEFLEERPYLWYLAEYDPEHLNEVGTRWLAEKIASQLTRPSK